MKIKRNYNFSLKQIIVIFIVISIFGGAIIYSAAKSIDWSVNRYQEFKSSEHKSLFSGMKNIFEKKEPQNIQPIKIVNEQSQVIEVVKKASPAVVSIVASAEIPTFENYFDVPLGIPEEFGQFFGAPQRRQNGTQEQQIGAGTGFLVSSDGYIVTNKHVVSQEDADYTVYLNNEENRGEKIKVWVMARDPENDLAILKIDKKDLPFLTFSDSSQLQVGQTAITIGYALGEFENTVSKGIISGLSRSITTRGGFSSPSEKLKNLIQSDAAINPGNSGGPMLDIEGNVIGINVAMASAENIGFALPGNEAMEVFREVKETGVIKEKENAYLGVRYLLLNKSLKKNNDLPYDFGALILRGEKLSDLAVIPGSPADKAGLIENDIILEINNEKITERNTLGDMVDKYKPGDEVTLKIYHKDQVKEVKIILGKI